MESDEDVRSKLSETISKHRDTPRLIEGQPMFDAIAKPLKAKSRVVDEIRNDASVEPAAILFVEGGGEIPAEGRDAISC